MDGVCWMHADLWSVWTIWRREKSLGQIYAAATLPPPPKKKKVPRHTLNRKRGVGGVSTAVWTIRKREISFAPAKYLMAVPRSSKPWHRRDIRRYWREMHDEELHSLYFLLNICRTMNKEWWDRRACSTLKLQKENRRISTCSCSLYRYVISLAW